MEFRRPIFETALARATEPRRFIQVLSGPRQAGKTTIAHQVLGTAGLPSHYATADDPGGRDSAWLEVQWGIGRLRARGAGAEGALLVLDEIQRIRGWSELVKRLWDADAAGAVPLKVFLVGSSPLLVQRGLSESLVDRFEHIPVPHWSYSEMREAFGFDLERFLFFGGYPGAAPLIDDEERWRHYILDSLVETALTRDVLLLTRVDKPALLRHLFRLACENSGQVISYTKMVGRLHDAGNTTTLSHYLGLLGGAGLVTGLERFSGARMRQRASSPKLLVLNAALMTATSGRTFRKAREDADFWGRLVESAVGTHVYKADVELFYWRERGREVDFVTRVGRALTAIEVTSGRRKDALPGLAEFDRRYGPERKLLVGAGGVDLGEFLAAPAAHWLEAEAASGSDVVPLGVELDVVVRRP